MFFRNSIAGISEVVIIPAQLYAARSDNSLHGNMANSKIQPVMKLIFAQRSFVGTPPNSMRVSDGHC